MQAKVVQAKKLLLALFVAGLAVNGDNVTILLLGDINISQRADPTNAFANVLQPLKSADLVYGNVVCAGSANRHGLPSGSGTDAVEGRFDD